MRVLALAVISCVLCVLVAGCGSHGFDTASASAGPAPSVSTTTTPPERAADNPAVVFTDNPALVDSRPLPFDSWTRVNNGDALALNFTLGSPDCFGVHATVHETAETVAVELRSGSRPEAVGRMCTMIAVFGTLDVPLPSPLGDRQVLSVF